MELGKVEKCATDVMSQIEEIAQFVRRARLEISGIKPSAECTRENIVISIGKAIGVPIVKEEISIAHQIPTYKENAPPQKISESLTLYKKHFSVSKQAKEEIEVEVHMDTEWNNLYQSKGEFQYDS